MLVSADVDSLFDAVMGSLLDGDRLGPEQQLRRIDAALGGTRHRRLLLDKAWGGPAAGFLAAWLLLEALYLIVAFAAPGEVTWYGRAVLIILATVPAWSLVQCLTLMARPGDRWGRHFSLNFSTARATFEAQRLFHDGQSFRQILKEERLGFTVGDAIVTTRTVIGAAATASLGLLFCLIEVQAESI